jgi:A/G-specific adenine glycosylase
VAPVYEEFESHYPTAEEFIDSGKAEAERIFEKLGLRWRAHHFWRLNETLAEEYGGAVPQEADALRALPSVGQYVETAVRVFAFGQKATIVDSNVLRVFGRYYGIEFADHARRSKRVLEWASEHAPKDPAEIKRFNWSLIDFGALVCVPAHPRCELCPVAANCWYYSSPV